MLTKKRLKEICGNSEIDGHKSDCELGNLLKEMKEVDK